MDLPPPDAAASLPKYSRYKSVRRGTAGDTQKGLNSTSSNPALPAGFDDSMSRYRSTKVPRQADRLQSVPALPSQYPPIPSLLRSHTSELGVVLGREAQSAETSPTTLNRAQQEAFDILTGKKSRQQLKPQKSLEQDRARRESLAGDFRRKQKEEQTRREAEERTREDARQRAHATRNARERAEEARPSGDTPEARRYKSRPNGEGRQVSRTTSDDLKQSVRDIKAKQNGTKTAKSYEQLASPSLSLRSPIDFASSSSSKPVPHAYEHPTGQDGLPVSLEVAQSKKLVKRNAPEHVRRADTTSANEPIRREDSREAKKEATGPNFDAPKSAVNAGVRTVKVMYGENSMKLPVTPTSTPVDLLSSARDLLEYGFDPQHYVLQENFKQLELQRPLRYYEHVRDVMNSWNSDEQHWFNIVSAAAEWDSAGLRHAKVPKEQPEETTVIVYHSQRPRVWDKRAVTLRSDGQVVIRKHEGAPATNICHMSDFDVFMPTRKEMKELKAPRKFCFAIKSLQKPAMFLNTANFVHFISTKDQDLAMEWYKAIHGWRSWYLVNTLGLGKEPPQNASEAPNEPLVTNIRGRNFSTASSNQSYQAHPGLEDRMLPDTNLVSSPLADSPKHTLPKPFNSRGGPPVAFPRASYRDSEEGSRVRARSTSRTRSSSIAQGRPSVDSEPFASTGLLGRTYTLRRQAMDKEPEAVPSIPDFPIKPLVDLTGEKKAAPQFSRKGHGVVPDSVPTGGLVTAATSTSPEHAPTHMASGEYSGGEGGFQCANSRRTGTMKNEQHYHDAFTGGLLASAGSGQGDRRRGKGVAVGDRNATEPMLNMEQESAYAPGSLLHSVESCEDKGLVIQREKVREVTTRTGEAA